MNHPGHPQTHHHEMEDASHSPAQSSEGYASGSRDLRQVSTSHNIFHNNPDSELLARGLGGGSSNVDGKVKLYTEKLLSVFGQCMKEVAHPMVGAFVPEDSDFRDADYLTGVSVSLASIQEKLTTIENRISLLVREIISNGQIKKKRGRPKEVQDTGETSAVPPPPSPEETAGSSSQVPRRKPGRPRKDMSLHYRANLIRDHHPPERILRSQTQRCPINLSTRHQSDPSRNTAKQPSESSVAVSRVTRMQLINPTRPPEIPLLKKRGRPRKMMSNLFQRTRRDTEEGSVDGDGDGDQGGALESSSASRATRTIKGQRATFLPPEIERRLEEDLCDLEEMIRVTDKDEKLLREIISDERKQSFLIRHRHRHQFVDDEPPNPPVNSSATSEPLSSQNLSHHNSSGLRKRKPFSHKSPEEKHAIYEFSKRYRNRLSQKVIEKFLCTKYKISSSTLRDIVRSGDRGVDFLQLKTTRVTGCLSTSVKSLQRFNRLRNRSNANSNADNNNAASKEQAEQGLELPPSDASGQARKFISSRTKEATYLYYLRSRSTKTFDQIFATVKSKYGIGITTFRKIISLGNAGRTFDRKKKNSEPNRKYPVDLVQKMIQFARENITITCKEIAARFGMKLGYVKEQLWRNKIRRLSSRDKRAIKLSQEGRPYEPCMSSEQAQKLRLVRAQQRKRPPVQKLSQDNLNESIDVGIETSQVVEQISEVFYHHQQQPLGGITEQDSHLRTSSFTPLLPSNVQYQPFSPHPPSQSLPPLPPLAGGQPQQVYPLDCVLYSADNATDPNRQLTTTTGGGYGESTVSGGTTGLLPVNMTIHHHQGTYHDGMMDGNHHHPAHHQTAAYLGDPQPHDLRYHLNLLPN